jgi:hypothetical protein
MFVIRHDVAQGWQVALWTVLGMTLLAAGMDHHGRSIGLPVRFVGLVTASMIIKCSLAKHSCWQGSWEMNVEVAAGGRDHARTLPIAEKCL